MSRELGLAGLVAIVFALGAYYATGELGAFSLANGALGGLALAAAALLRARRMRQAGGPHARRVMLRGLLWIAAALALGVALERGAASSGVRFDLTFEQSFELSPAVARVLGELPGPVTATLYLQPEDPRLRRTRLLLDTLAASADGRLSWRERALEEYPQDADRFAIGTSNSVLFELNDRWELVERPTEGTLFEALYQLRQRGLGGVLMLRGEGEGDPEDVSEAGYSGLAAALATEGYEVHSQVSPALTEVAPEISVVLAIAPERELLPQTLAALRRHLETGGALVALLEPGRETGLEGLLAEYGVRAEAAWVVDPASTPAAEGRPAGFDLIAFNYESHPVTRGLGPNRMTYLPGACAFELHKPGPDAELQRLVLSTFRAQLTADLGAPNRGRSAPDLGDAPRGYRTLVAAGRYPAEPGEARIVAFCDADLASNQHLRSLYNLDLVLNAVHWATRREAEITLRPKTRQRLRETVQFPMPLGSTVGALYGLGLLIPELLLIAGGIVWLRSRSL